MPAAKAPFLRFLESFDICKETGCWIWNGGVMTSGYGRIKVFGEWEGAHRLSHALYNGPVPEGAHVLHSCDVKLCVNPDHLRIGTHQENMAEAGERGLMRSGENHPRYGKKNPRPRQANRVLVLGVEYDSQKSAERALGLGSGTVRYWIKTGSPKASMISKGELNARN